MCAKCSATPLQNRYTFEYPTGWKSEVPSKVEKGTQGIDGRVVNPRSKGAPRRPLHGERSKCRSQPLFVSVRAPCSTPHAAR